LNVKPVETTLQRSVKTREERKGRS